MHEPRLANVARTPLHSECSSLQNSIWVYCLYIILKIKSISVRPFSRKSLFGFVGPFERSLFCEPEFSYSPSTDLWWANPQARNEVQALSRRICIQTHTQTHRRYFKNCFSELKTCTCQNFKISFFTITKHDLKKICVWESKNNGSQVKSSVRALQEMNPQMPMAITNSR
jgi:hypothetical protein